MMLWKEFRENFKWALMAAIALVLAEMYALTQQNLFNMYQESSTPLCKASFLMATTFGCEAVGLILGFLQILPEQRRDQWAALIHRPVERAVIYRGKAVAGLILYLAATVIPFLICIWYAAPQGHLGSPFVPRSIYPGLADICAGSMFYFAALFTALRRGPWFGPRIFGLLAAYYTSGFVAETYHPLYPVIEAAVVMSLALFTAAWSVIFSNGSFHVQPWLGRFAVLAVVFYGACGLGSITNSIVGIFQSPDYYYGNQYMVDVKGRVLVRINSQNKPTRYTDLAGHPVTDRELLKQNYRYQLYFGELSSWVGNSHSERYTPLGQGYRSGETYVAQVQEQLPMGAWYYLVRERYFVGLGASDHGMRLGQNGFKEGNEPVEPFSQPVESGYQVMAFVKIGSGAYYLDFGDRQITPIYSGPDLFGVAPLASYQNNQQSDDWGAVALLHEVQIIDKNGKLIATLPYHQDMDRYGRVDVAVMPSRDKFFLWYMPSTWIDYHLTTNMPQYMEEMDLQGNLLNSYTLPPFSPVHQQRSWQQYMGECTQSPVYNYGEILYDKIGAMAGSDRLQKEIKSTLGWDWASTRDILVRCTLTSLALALVTLFWAQSAFFSWPRALAWAAFVLGFNLAGFITFRLCADWPTLVPCPKCGKKRPIHLDQCPACEAGWPAPVREGTEIFDAPEVATAAI